MADTYHILRESYNYFSDLVSLLILMILTRSGPMADTYQILRESYNYFSDLQFLDSSPRISAVSGFKTCLVGLEPNTMNSAENEDHVDMDTDNAKDQINQSARKVQSLVLQSSATKMLKVK